MNTIDKVKKQFILYYFRFFNSSNRRAKSSKPGSSEPSFAGGGDGVGRSCALGT